MADVALLKCTSYSPDILKTKVLDGLGLIGFDPDRFRGARVALKPNLLSAVDPESAVVTHPCIFEAVAQIVVDYGGSPVLIESPAVVSLHNALKKARYLPIIQKLGIEIADTDSVEKISFDRARIFKHFEISSAFFGVDIIVNIPKLKTHGLTYVTAAVKNLFGAVPGKRKSQMHLRFPEKREFCEHILDLYGAFLTGFPVPKTMLHILDAVVSLQGEGPGTSGKPKHTGAIIMSQDALAVDYTAVMLAGLDMNQVTTLTSGFSRNLGISCPEDVHIRGESLDDMRIHDFIPAKSPGISFFLKNKFIKSIMRNLFVEKPLPLPNACILCYQCRSICPAQAINVALNGENVPDFDYHRCIRCFCCQEICPAGAITLRPGKMQWLLVRR